jgi:hypothetical protein
MNASETILILTLFRLVIPFGILLIIGEWLNRRERARRYRM